MRAAWEGSWKRGVEDIAVLFSLAKRHCLIKTALQTSEQPSVGVY